MDQGNPLDKPTVILAGIGMSAVGALFYNLLPLFLGAAQDYRGLSNPQLGLVSAAYFVGFTLATLTAFFWIRRASWRNVSLAVLPVAALSLLCAVIASDYAWLLVTVFLAGAALSVVYGIGTTTLGDTSRPARWYGMKIAAEAGTGAVLLLFLPALVISRWGLGGIIITMVAVVVLFMPLGLLLPHGGVKGSDLDRVGGDPGVKASHPILVWMALLGCLLFMCGQTAIWAFVERIGNSAGHDPVQVGRLLAVTLVFALSGSFLAAWAGERLGCARPFAFACICFFAALLFLYRGELFNTYAVGACLVMFSVGLGLPLAVTSVALLDQDGRFVVLSVPAIGLGVMIGPAAAGMLAAGHSFVPVLLLGAIAVGGSLASLMFGLARSAQKAQPADFVV